MSAVVGDEAEDTRLRVSRLRLWRQRADLGKAAPHGEHRVGNARVFVVARGDAQRVRKVKIENVLT